MTQTLDLFSGAELKERGQVQVLSNDEEWGDRAARIIRTCARLYNDFTADEVRAMAAGEGLEEPHHPNAWGAIFSKVAKEGIIVKTGAIRPSSLSQSHARNLLVWRRTI